MFMWLNIAQQTFVLMKTSWRRLSSSSLEDVFKTSSKCLGQGEYIRPSQTVIYRKICPSQTSEKFMVRV